MWTTRRSFSAVVVMAVVAAVAAPALARRGPHGPGGKHGMHHGFMRAELIGEVASELGISDDKLKQIKEMVYEANRKVVDLRADVQRARLELQHLMNADEPDKAKVLKLVEDLGRKETRVHKNRIELMLSVRALLTPEQRRRLSELMAARRGGWRTNGGPGRGAGRGPGGGGGPCGMPGGCPGVAPPG